MEPLLYRVIKTEKQYFEYCNVLEELLNLKKKNRKHEDAIELLTVLIEKWDEDHHPSKSTNPVELLKYLMQENKLKAIDLANLLEISKSLVSDILNYRRGLSKEVIRKLADRFSMSQHAFNKPYKLVSPVNPPAKKSHIISTAKKLPKAS